MDGRTRNRQERRDRVYRAAIDLFVEQGYGDTTMEDIADRAGVARATVFNHFERKAAFLGEWASRRRSNARASLFQQGIGDDVRGRLARYLAELASLSTNSRDETVAVLGAAAHSMNIYTSPSGARRRPCRGSRGRTAAGADQAGCGPAARGLAARRRLLPDAQQVGRRRTGVVLRSWPWEATRPSRPQQENAVRESDERVRDYGARLVCQTS